MATHNDVRIYRYVLSDSLKLTANRVSRNEKNYNRNNNSGKLINTIGYFAALPGLPNVVGAVGLGISTLSYVGSLFGSGRNLVDFFDTL